MSPGHFRGRRPKPGDDQQLTALFRPDPRSYCDLSLAPMRQRSYVAFMVRAMTVRNSFVPRGPGRPPRALGAQLAELILDAAQDLFLKQGYEATTLEQIAARIG